jgi:hypothetical protein
MGKVEMWSWTYICTKCCSEVLETVVRKQERKLKMWVTFVYSVVYTLTCNLGST